MRKLILIALLSCSAMVAAAQGLQFEVTADSTNRIVRVRLPKPIPNNPVYEFVNVKTGQALPAQFLNVVTLVFIADLGNNTYQLKRTEKKFKSGITIDKKENGLLVKVKNKPLFFYHTKEAMPPADSPAYYRRSGFIHPLYSPNGSILTDDFPAGHAHQHGIFMTWVNTTYRNQKLDFWNQHQKTGTVAHSEILSIEEGPVFTRIKTKLHHISLTAGPVLEEVWTITIYPFADNFLFDLESTQVNITSDTLYLNQYHYGGLAFRGSKEWNRHDTAHFKNDWKIITSEGKDNSSANATHARWVDASGKLNGNISGVTVFGDSSNFRYPQSIRLHPDMPYWAFSPVVDGPFTFAPGERYTSHFRYFVHAGAASINTIEKINASFVKPTRLPVGLYE